MSIILQYVVFFHYSVVSWEPKNYTYVIVASSADRAALALDALPAVLTYRYDHVVCELQTRGMTWGHTQPNVTSADEYSGNNS